MTPQAVRSPEKRRSIETGNAGEALVLAHLLANGFHAAHTARNSPAFDILARKHGRYAAIRVKTGRLGPQWTAKKNGSLFLDAVEGDRTDFVVFVVGDTQRLADVSFYIVPTMVVESAMRRDVELTDARLKRSRRLPLSKRENRHRALWFCYSPERPFRGYDKRWAKYRDAWHLLEGQ